MKSTSAAEPSGGSKRILADLLIIATIFVLLGAFHPMVLAPYMGRYYVTVSDENAAFVFHVVNGTQNTTNHTLNVYHDPYGGASVSASYLNLDQIFGLEFNWMQVGWLQGNAPTTPPTWVDTPYYYVDRSIRGVYNCSLFGLAPLAASHAYKIIAYTVGSNDTMYAFIDNILKVNASGYRSLGNSASGASETHNILDEMNSFFLAMQAGVNWLQPVHFQNDQLNETDNPPYHASPRPPLLMDRWTATGQGY